MATLTADEKAELRSKLIAWRASNGLTNKEGRSCLDQVHQVLEDQFESIRALINSGIDSIATDNGISYTGAEKKAMFRHWLYLKFLKEV